MSLKSWLQWLFNLVLFVVMITAGTVLGSQLFENILPFYVSIMFVVNIIITALALIGMFFISEILAQGNADDTIKSALKSKEMPVVQGFVSFVYLAATFLLAGYAHYVLAFLMLLILFMKALTYGISLVIRKQVIESGYVLDQDGNVQRVVSGATVSLKDVSSKA